MGLLEGDVVTLRTLACGMLLKSGNDGANAAAVRIAGSIPEFAKQMNRRAAAIGMANTNLFTPLDWMLRSTIPPPTIWPFWLVRR